MQRPENKDLIIPINTLENEKDKKRFGEKGKQELKKDYGKIFDLIDTNIFLKSTSFECI